MEGGSDRDLRILDAVSSSNNTTEDNGDGASKQSSDKPTNDDTNSKKLSVNKVTLKQTTFTEKHGLFCFRENAKEVHLMMAQYLILIMELLTVMVALYSTNNKIIYSYSFGS